MIRIKKIKKLKCISDYFSGEKSYDLIFIGAPIDERTFSIREEIAKNSKIDNVYRVNIDIENYTIMINDLPVKILFLHRFLQEVIAPIKVPSILIEATSLDFSEILYLVNALKIIPSIEEITISYIEPASYSESPSHQKETSEFLLSKSNQKFIGLPFFSLNSQESDKSHLVAILGFENHRLGQALEEDDGSSFSNMHAMIGIPAFKPGWENKSISRHLDHFEKIKTKLHLYPATNPYEINKFLEDLYRGYNKIVIASMGTKPAALAAVIFLVNNAPNNSRLKQVGAIYDFPIKKAGRTVGVGDMFDYKISFELRGD